MHGLTNDLTWVEERSVMALANYVPHVSQVVAQIGGLPTGELARRFLHVRGERRGRGGRERTGKGP